MNQPSEEPNRNALAIVPAKKKRGRPRKYPRADDPNFHHGRSKFRVPPGFRESKGNQTQQSNPIHTAKDSMAGQLVSGVIESEFDGGYLLTVKVRNSDITLRGVVFKPGRCDPVTAENDVAPNVQMVHRNEVPLSSESYGRVSKYRSRGRHRVANPPLSTSLVALKSKLASQPPPATDQAIVPLRGNVVPVVLQPIVASSNEGPFLNPYGSFGSEEAQPVALQVVHPFDELGQMQRQVPRNGSDSAPAQQPLGQEKASSPEPEQDVKPVRPPPGMPYMNVMKDIIIHDKQAKEVMAADGASTTNLHHHHMFMEPFHTLQHFTMNPSNAVPSPLDSESGKMTKLLQVHSKHSSRSQLLS